MYKNIINLLSATLDYYRKIPATETLTERDKYYITEGLTIAITSIKAQEEFVAENLSYEVLEETLLAVKDFVELVQVEDMVKDLLGESTVVK